MSMIRLAAFGSALVLSALIGGTIIGSVAANTLPPAESAAPAAAQVPVAAEVAPTGAVAARTAGKYCETFLKAYAAALGVDASALGPAATRAAESTIDAAVAAGDLTTVQAERLRTRLEEAQLGGCPKFADRIGQARPTAGVMKDGFAAVADALGMTPADLQAQLRNGKSLKDIATARGVTYETVTAEAIRDVKAKLDAAVAAGTIKQAKADRILARLERNLAAGRLRNGRPAASATPGG